MAVDVPPSKLAGVLGDDAKEIEIGLRARLIAEQSHRDPARTGETDSDADGLLQITPTSSRRRIEGRLTEQGGDGEQPVIGGSRGITRAGKVGAEGGKRRLSQV